MIIAPDEWKPADELIIEDRAMETIMSSMNFYVIAGPGAGKTELLAQRACYLLQTNSCKDPRKILAISFKRDAAKNIGERVKKRCGNELSRRFISQTYDSFAKGLLDHFRRSLPEDYMPSKEYQIVLSARDIIDPYLGSNSYELRSLSQDQIRYLPRFLTSDKLPFNLDSKCNITELIYKIWMDALKKDNNAPSQLTFPMISRLSEYLLRCNPKICNALISTYSHVFLDEFQDTTTFQYDLIKTCFHNTDTILTAVGDKKQRIMVWAGADTEVFDKFENDFKARKRELLMNYRSAPRLVEIQKILIKNMSSDDSNISTHTRWKNTDGICEIWNFKNSQEEAEMLSSEINDWIHEEQLNPNDICVIVKQRPNEYCENLIENLSEYDIKARNESLLQDLISEECVNILLDVITCTFSKASREEWTNIRELIKLIKHISQEEESNYNDLRLLDQEFKLATEKFRETFSKITTEKELKKGLDTIINYLGKEELLNLYPQYKQGTYFDQRIGELSRHLWDEFYSCKDWIHSVQALRGIDSIPIMTIHKSKGLEYDTVIFIGLEDGAFWSFRNQSEEDTCAFFVALSRAKRRVIFTFSETRNDRRGYTRKQQKSNINSLYSMLEESGVVETLDF